MQGTFTRFNLIASDAAASFLLDTMIKATVLLLVACLAAALLRRASAGVRHRVWCLGFLSLLLLPAVSLALPHWRIPILPQVITAGTPSPGVPERQAPSASSDVSQADLSYVAARRPQASSGQDTLTTPTLNPTGMRTDGTAPVAAESIEGARLSSDTAMGGSGQVAATRSWPKAVVLSWLAGILASLFPLVVSLLHNRIRGRNARPVVDSEGCKLLAEVRDVLGVRRAVRLLETDVPLVPMTWGVWRPTVLLPRQWRQWPLERRRMVLLHELAHVQRWDVGVQFLARLACALYWFHPLAWYALWRLRVERESACDDCALVAGERSSDYAQQLLEIARDYRFVTQSAAAVAMAQSTRLERRVRALLDHARSHLPVSRAMGHWTLVAAMLMLAGVAVIGPANTAEPQGAGLGPTAPAAEKASPPQGGAGLVGMVAKQFTVRGTVVLPDGKPAADATVRAAIAEWAMLEPIMAERGKPPVSEAKTNAKGEFTISFPENPLGNLSRLDPRWQQIAKKTNIAASAPGYGPAWVTYEDLQPGQPLELKLTEDLPIQGRVVDPTGRPVAGLAIEVGDLWAAKDGDLAPWLRAVKAGEPPWTAWSLASKSISPAFIGVPKQVITDAEGRFEIRGVGRQRHLGLSFHSETAAYVTIGVATLSMERVDMVISPPPFAGTQPLFGAEFTVTTTPSRPIVGTVRDTKTGQPLAGVGVESYKLANNPYSNNRVLKTTTDQEGRFRLVGMPEGEGNELIAVPNDDQPYFIRVVKAPKLEGSDPATVEIKLDRGIWITGRVTDKATGQPVVARLYYLPFLSNPFAEASVSFHKDSDDWGNVDNDQDRYRSHLDGSYRLVGLPGPAIVGALSVLRQYRMGVGSEAIEGLDEKGDFKTYANPITPGIKWPNVLKKIDPPADAQSTTVDFEMDPGLSVRVAMVDPTGQPLSDVLVDGATSHGYAETILESSFEAVNLSPDETRTILFHQEARKLGWVLRISANQAGGQPVTVRLQPTGVVKGRLVKPDGKPVTGAEIRMWCNPSEDFGKSLPLITTDAEGRFEGTLLPGTTYNLIARGMGIPSSADVVQKDVTIEPGQVKDLGDVTVGREQRE